MFRRILLSAALLLTVLSVGSSASAEAVCARAFYPNVAAVVCVPLP